MPKPKGGLGRGLGSLIPQGAPQRNEPPESARPQEPGQAGPGAAPASTPTPTSAQGPAGGALASQSVSDTSLLPPNQGDGGEQHQGNTQGLTMLPVGDISPNPHQPRQQFPEEDLEELAASIREHGVIQPLVVTRSLAPGKYNLIAGERRWRAAALAELEAVPVLVKEATSRQMLEIALVENLQRADLNPLEEASAYRSLIDDFGLTQEDVAARVGRSRGAVANSVRLLRLPASIQEALSSGAISEGHARAILQVPDEAEQLWLAERITSAGLSVRQAEALARKLAERGKPDDEQAGEQQSADAPLYDEMRSIEDRFRDALGTRVQLSRSSRGGRLVIYFYSDEELGRIYGTIVGEDE